MFEEKLGKIFEMSRYFTNKKTEQPAKDQRSRTTYNYQSIHETVDFEEIMLKHIVKIVERNVWKNV